MDTHGDILVSVQTKPLLDAMTGTLNKEQAETLCQELNDVEAKALVNTLLPMGDDVEAETLGNQPCNVTYTLAEAEDLNLGDTWKKSTPRHWSIS